MLFLIARQAKSKDPAARRRAAERLGAGGRPGGAGPLPRHVMLLLDLARDGDAAVRVAAYDSLGRVADARAIESMAAALKDLDRLGEPAATAVRDAAARAFHGIGPGATPAIVQLTRDRNTRTREAAVAALGQLGGADAEAVLVGALQDSRSSVRQIAVRALAARTTAGSIGALSAALEHRDPATRRTAIEAIAGIRSADGPRAVARLARDPDRSVREAAVNALARQASPEAVDALLGVFEGADRDMRQLAAAALKDLDWQPATPRQRALRGMLRGDYQAAAMEGEAAIEPLAVALGDKSAAARKAAAEALGRTGHPASVKPLLASLQDADGGVRQAAADALVAVGAAAAVPLACAVHEAARSAAPEIVARIGPAAASPLLDLLEQGERYTGDGAEMRRVPDEEAAERADRAAHFLHRLLGQSAAALDRQALARAARLRDIVRVREITPASRRDSMTTMVETVVDCNDLRARAAAELERRRV